MCDGRVPSEAVWAGPPVRRNERSEEWCGRLDMGTLCREREGGRERGRERGEGEREQCDGAQGSSVLLHYLEESGCHEKVLQRGVHLIGIHVPTHVCMQ